MWASSSFLCIGHSHNNMVYNNARLVHLYIDRQKLSAVILVWDSLQRMHHYATLVNAVDIVDRDATCNTLIIPSRV